MRALWIAMDEWVTRGREPPDSQVPTFHDKTLVSPDQKSVGFPSIPGVTYTGLKTTRYRFNWGNDHFYDSGSTNFGIPFANPPINSDRAPIPFGPPYEDNPKNGHIYPSFVPKTDRDGNDIAGIRLADVTVPVATYTGWALRAGPQANDGCESSGQFIPFAQTEAPAGDPRPSTAARYGTLELDPSGQLLARFAEKRPGAALVNAGVYVLRADCVRALPRSRPLSFEFEVFTTLLDRGAKVAVVAVDAPFLDIGTAESLRRADQFVRTHMVVKNPASEPSSRRPAR